MSIRNYRSKINLAFSISRNFSFLKLLINSKRYSSRFKGGTLDSKDPECSEYSFNMYGRKCSFIMRTFQGDIDIFYEIFWNKVYQIPENKVVSPKVIIDLGAHIGFASIFFSFVFPRAKIFSVEASVENYKVLKHNTKEFENIFSINKAIYHKNGMVKFQSSEMSYNNKIGEGGISLESISMESLMEKYGIEHINLLKIDIEGAEKVLLTENNRWLEKVDNIIIELHSPYTIVELQKVLSEFKFEIVETVNEKKDIFFLCKN